MFGLTGRPAFVAVAGADQMQVSPAGHAPFVVSVAHLPWVLFLRAGDAWSADEVGWWLFGRIDGGALALSANCPGLEGIVRGPLRAALDGARAKLWLDVAAPPRELRGRAARAGWAELDRAAASVLLSDPSAVVLTSVEQAPNLP